MVGMQSAAMYIGRRQAKVAQWVALRLLLDVCAHKIGYGGGGRKRQLWWRQGDTVELLRTTLKEALR